jgi:ATP-dependent Clp protease ATP-binding subunit ClpA
MKHFKPAFLGRLTVVPFYPIDDEVLANIIRLKLERIKARVAANHDARSSTTTRWWRRCWRAAPRSIRARATSTPS